MATLNPTHSCASCGKEAKHRCSACGEAWYSGIEHQKVHWKQGQHSKQCLSHTERKEIDKFATRAAWGWEEKTRNLSAEVIRDIQVEDKTLKEFIETHPSPSEDRIRRYLREDPSFMHGAKLGPLYRHNLAKRLYDAGTLGFSSYEQVKEMRTIGYLLHKQQGGGIELMRSYFYLIQHILCGPGIWTEERPVPRGHYISPLSGYAKQIETNWNMVGSWMA